MYISMCISGRYGQDKEGKTLLIKYFCIKKIHLIYTYVDFLMSILEFLPYASLFMKGRLFDLGLVS